MIAVLSITIYFLIGFIAAMYAVLIADEKVDLQHNIQVTLLFVLYCAVWPLLVVLSSMESFGGFIREMEGKWNERANKRI